MSATHHAVRPPAHCAARGRPGSSPAGAGGHAARAPAQQGTPAELPGWRLVGSADGDTLSRVAASLTDPVRTTSESSAGGVLKAQRERSGFEREPTIRQKQRWLKCKKSAYPDLHRSTQPSCAEPQGRPMDCISAAPGRTAHNCRQSARGKRPRPGGMDSHPPSRAIHARQAL